MTGILVRHVGALCCSALCSVAAAAQPVLTAPLPRFDNSEAIVSSVSIPAGATLPRHWHPGEEFAYVIAGAVTLRRAGEEPLLMTPGTAAVIPAEVVHDATAGSEGAELVVFRVHVVGEPVRVLVDSADPS